MINFLSDMNEIWKPIPGYDGLYDASSLGRIRSVENRRTVDSTGRIRTWHKTGIMKQKTSPSQLKNRGRDDARITLYKNGEPKDYKVARLIVMAFHGMPEQGMTVNHKNGDWRDNRSENLEWMTNLENIHHARDNHLYHDKKPIMLIDTDGNQYVFDSILAASNFLNRKRNYLYVARNKHLANAYSADGKLYHFYLL